MIILGTRITQIERIYTDFLISNRSCKIASSISTLIKKSV